MAWQTSRFLIDLQRPQVMGIVNATPDSFSDGGRHSSPALAMAHCERLLAEGVDILDIGGESTRPGSVMPTWEEELARVLPVVRHAVTLGVPVSVDTSRPEVIAEVLAAGADIINDVRSLTWPGALACVAQAPLAGVCVMHMQGQPGTMQLQPHYGSLLAEVSAFLAERVQVLREAGVADARIMLDPGYGFGKTDEHNWALLRGQVQLLELGFPLLAGWSRKGTLGKLTGRPVGERMVASVAAALAAATHGARVLRVHDVAATVDALKVWQAAGLAG
jgi:dihydropteroate synthase